MNHFLTERFNRRGFLRMAGATTVSAAVLAACRKAENVGGGATGTSGTAVHPPIGQEPGNLQVFDWSGYGNGDYYPDKERLGLWQQYADATGDTPQFILFANDDAGYTKAATGAVRFDVVHPCFYKYRDWVDLGAVQPWDTSLISNFSRSGTYPTAARRRDPPSPGTCRSTGARRRTSLRRSRPSCSPRRRSRTG